MKNFYVLPICQVYTEEMDILTLSTEQSGSADDMLSIGFDEFAGNLNE